MAVKARTKKVTTTETAAPKADAPKAPHLTFDKAMDSAVVAAYLARYDGESPSTEDTIDEIVEGLVEHEAFAGVKELVTATRVTNAAGRIRKELKKMGYTLPRTAVRRYRANAAALLEEFEGLPKLAVGADDGDK